MSADPQLFRVDPNSKALNKIREVDFANLGLQERDIQDWVVANSDILGDELLVVAKEFSDFDRTKERLDLLAVDPDGKLVIIELKRDHSGADAHWQAIKYASYLRQATQEQIVQMLAAHESLSKSEAADKLIDHMESDSLENLNHDQRIILASHRFAAEVTSAALWMNSKSRSENLITCIQITPYQDGDALYLQSNILIPVPGAEPYTIQIGNEASDDNGSGASSGAGIKAARRRTRNRNDDVTHFVRNVEARVLDQLSVHLKTDSRSRHAMGGSSERWYCMWYRDRFPWANAQFTYVLHVNSRNDGSYRVRVGFETRKRYLRQTLGYTEGEIRELKHLLESHLECEIQDNNTFLRPRETIVEGATTFNDELLDTTTDALKKMIETVTEPVEQFVKSRCEDADN